MANINEKKDLENSHKDNNFSNGYSKNQNDILLNGREGKAVIQTTNIPISTVSPTVLHNFKSWSLNAFKYAKQFFSEHLSQGTRTMDIGLDRKIETINNSRNQLSSLLKNINQLLIERQKVISIHNQLAEAFLELVPLSTDASLRQEILINADIQKLLAKNENILLPSIKSFQKNISTLCHIAIEDALNTVKLYETARLKFDAHRVHMDSLRCLPKSQANMLKLQASEATFLQNKVTFERLHHDLNIKLQFLENNKVLVCEKNLMSLNEAFLFYIESTNNDIIEILNLQSRPCNSKDFEDT